MPVNRSGLRVSSHPNQAAEVTSCFGGKITVPRCQALSKRTGHQCRKPAMRGRAVCRTHGGASSGPKTQAGRRRCAGAKTIHGRETREIRRRRAEGLAELRTLELVMAKLGMLE